MSNYAKGSEAWNEEVFRVCDSIPVSGALAEYDISMRHNGIWGCTAPDQERGAQDRRPGAQDETLRGKGSPR